MGYNTTPVTQHNVNSMTPGHAADIEKHFANGCLVEHTLDYGERDIPGFRARVYIGVVVGVFAKKRWS